jgi:hypothetical protein
LAVRFVDGFFFVALARVALTFERSDFTVFDLPTAATFERRDFTVLDLAIFCALAPAMPPATAPMAADTGPSSAPVAAPAAAPPTIPTPDTEPDFFFALAISVPFTPIVVPEDLQNGGMRDTAETVPTTAPESFRLYAGIAKPQARWTLFALADVARLPITTLAVRYY